jgi:hypothetical protein
MNLPYSDDRNLYYSTCIAKKLINVNITENIDLPVIGFRRLTDGFINIGNVALKEISIIYQPEVARNLVSLIN